MSKKKRPAKKGFWGKVQDAAARQQAVERQKDKKKTPVEPVVSQPEIKKTPEERKKTHKEGIKKTVVPAILGTAAGFFSYFNLGDGTAYPWLSIMLLVIIFSYYAQRILFPFVGIDVKELGNKDWFYVEFITVDFWLVVWTLLLNPTI